MPVVDEEAVEVVGPDGDGVVVRVVDGRLCRDGDPARGEQGIDVCAVGVLAKGRDGPSISLDPRSPSAGCSSRWKVDTVGFD